MPRAKRGFKARRRRNKIMKAASGYVGARSRIYRQANMTVKRGLRYAYRDRRARKRDFRRLWIVRINAAARSCGLSYSRLIGLLKTSGIELDRRTLADIAVADAGAFAKLVDTARQA